jgi:hypothetical protein
MLESWESETLTVLDDERSGENRKEGGASYVFRHVSCSSHGYIGLLVGFMVLWLYRGGLFYWWRKPQTCRKSLILSHTSPWSGFELTSVLIGTDCIGSCKSNYCTITAIWIQRDTRLQIFKILKFHTQVHEGPYPVADPDFLHVPVYGISEIW